MRWATRSSDGRPQVIDVRPFVVCVEPHVLDGVAKLRGATRCRQSFKVPPRRRTLLKPNPALELVDVHAEEEEGTVHLADPEVMTSC